MLIGEYQHSLDIKKRVSIPAKFRKELGKKIILTRGLDKCLFLYPEKEWQKVAEKLNNLPVGQKDTRSFVRLFLAGAAEIEVDSLGRILIPEYLKNYAQLKEEIIITGVYHRLEIWDSELWAKYKGDIENQTDILAEELGKIGAY